MIEDGLISENSLILLVAELKLTQFFSPYKLMAVIFWEQIFKLRFFMLLVFFFWKGFEKALSCTLQAKSNLACSKWANEKDSNSVLFEPPNGLAHALL